MDKWKVISQKSVFKAKFFEVKEEKVLLPNNKKHIYATVERRSTVCIFPLTDRNDLYLISEYRQMYKKIFLKQLPGISTIMKHRLPREKES